MNLDGQPHIRTISNVRLQRFEYADQAELNILLSPTSSDSNTTLLSLYINVINSMIPFIMMLCIPLHYMRVTSVLPIRHASKSKVIHITNLLKALPDVKEGDYVIVTIEPLDVVNNGKKVSKE